MTLETEIPLFKRVELGQETIQSRNEVLPFFFKSGFLVSKVTEFFHHLTLLELG